MRIPLVLLVGIGVGGAVAIATVLLTSALPRSEERWSTAPPSPTNVGQPRGVDSTSSVAGPAVDPASHTPFGRSPITPDDRVRAGASRSIFRCRTKGATTYSNEPCPGGTVVDESSAVGGYDSRPSDRLAGLVAAGRERSDAIVVQRSTTAVASYGGRPESVDCANLSRQIRDLDEAARRPQSSLRVLDDLRQVRQDVMTSRARLHC